jgi:transcriptional regulator with XRE-family HTH domain
MNLHGIYAIIGPRSTQSGTLTTVADERIAMAPSSRPTQRQRRLGAEVRRMRMAAGMTPDQAATLLGLDRGKISGIEIGIRNINPDRLRTLAAHCGFTDEHYVEGLVAMTQSRKRQWWHEYRGKLPQGLLDISELEWHSEGIQTLQTVHVPGLFQTEDYARTIFEGFLPPISRLEVELRVAHRMGRQRVLNRENPVTYVGYIHEAALRMQFGGRAVTRKQLDTLAQASERDNVTLRVIPVERGHFPGAGHALLYSEAASPLLDTAQLDSAHGPDFMYSDEQLTQYRVHLEWMDKACLPPSESRDFIHSIARTL